MELKELLGCENEIDKGIGAAKMHEYMETGILTDTGS